MPTAAEMVAEAKKRVENLTVDETARELQGGDVLLVDIREPGERQQAGYIPEAVEAPRGMLEFWADPTSPYHREEFDPGRRIILHCASGGAPRSRRPCCRTSATTASRTWTAA